MSTSQLNDFQEMMRQWATLAPYNAGHIMRLSGVPDLERWSRALADALRPLGVTAGDRFLVEASAGHDLDAKIEAELNAPFPAVGPPLRSFVLRDGPGTYLFGLFFDHWFADAASIRLLLERVFSAYGGKGTSLPPLRTASAASHPRRLLRPMAFLSCVRGYFRHRSACRIALAQPLDLRVGFFSKHFPRGAIRNIQTLAREQAATVNDVFLAAIARLLGEFTAEARRTVRKKFLRARRDRIALATAVDLRPAVTNRSDDTFGLALGYFTLVLEAPEKRPFRELLGAIARETAASKAEAHAQQFAGSLRLARWMWNRSSRPWLRAQLFHRALPILAGISNVNLTGSWVDRAPATPGDNAILDYLRVGPTGPLLPLVFSLTTIADRLSLSVTYRRAAFSRKDAEAIASELIARLSGGGSTSYP